MHHRTTLGVAAALGLAGGCASHNALPDRAPIADATSSDDAPDVAAADATTDATTDADRGAHACTRPLAVESVVDLGVFSLPSSAVVSRDGTSTGSFMGRLLWTFGDTFLAHGNAIDNSSVLSATSGWSTAAAPLALDEPVDDGGLPAQLIPYTAAEISANRADALNGWALWPGAVIDTGGAQALVLFQRIKRSGGSGFASQGIGTARVAAGATVATRDPNDLFALPPDAGAGDAGAPTLYGSAGVSVIDGYAYFYECSAVGFLNTGCRVGRAPIAMADQRAAFQFYDGAAWQGDIEQAAVVIDQVGGGLSISLNPYLGCYLAVTGGVLSSSMILRTSSRLEAGWGPSSGGVTIAAAPDGGVLPAVDGAYDYLFVEHPELRSADGRQIVVSYAQPLGDFRGNVHLARVTLR